jgi:predicted nuclease of predicted toxin-antitoxin system
MYILGIEMSASENEEWFEITQDLWLDPKAFPKKLKLCSDASVPQPVIDELTTASIPILTAYDDKVSTHSDKSILAWSKRKKRVLLTMDRDFWNDRKFPLQIVHGLIFIDVSPNNIDDALKVFGLIYGTFASSYSIDWWQNMMARALPENYFLKMRTWEGMKSEYEIRLMDGILYAREIPQVDIIE